jgi:hypothetical protein
VNGPVYDVNQPRTFRFALADPDSNHYPPAAVLRRGIGSPVSMVVNAAGDTLQHRQPQLAAVVGMWQLADTSVTLSATQWSVTFAARALHGAVKPTCTTTIWLVDTFRVTESWVQGDTVAVAVGGDTLRLRNTVSVVGVPQSAGHGQVQSRFAISDPAGVRLALPLPAGTRVLRVEVFDGAGRLIASVTADPSGHVALPAALPRGLVCFRLHTAAGALTQVRVTLPGR